MAVLTKLTRRSRHLALGAVLAAAVALPALSERRAASAQAPPGMPIPAANLKVTGIGHVFMTPVDGAPATGFYLTFTVENSGSLAAPGFNIRTSGYSGTTIDIIPVRTGLAAGASKVFRDFSAKCGTGEPGYWRKVTVDSSDAVVESNKNDNIAFDYCPPM